MLVLLWVFALENVWFPASSRSTACSPSPPGTAGAPDAEPILLQFAADQIGRPVDRAAVLHFALPVPDWVYPVWLVAAAGLVLVLARWMIGRPWAATVVAAAYVGVPLRGVAGAGRATASRRPRCRSCCSALVAWRSTLAFLGRRLPEWLRPLLGALPGRGGRCRGRMVLQHEWLALPPIGADRARHRHAAAGRRCGSPAVLGVRSPAFARWSRPH